MSHRKFKLTNNQKLIVFSAAFIILLLLVSLITLTATASNLFDKWVQYDFETVKYSTVFCNEKRYVSSNSFRSDSCFEDCARRCLSTGYRYKNHFESDECNFGCGCECI